MTLPNSPTVSIRVAAELLGIGSSTAYAAARDGKFPTKIIRINGRYVVPTRPLLELLGLTDDAPKVA